MSSSRNSSEVDDSDYSIHLGPSKSNNPMLNMISRATDFVMNITPMKSEQSRELSDHRSSLKTNKPIFRNGKQSKMK